MSRTTGHEGSSVWSDDRVDTLKKLWAEGHSATQIAWTLGSVTRCSVLGKVHRLGLGGRDKPSAPPMAALRPLKPGETTTASAPRAIVAPAVVGDIKITSGLATVASLGRHMCKWPIGDPTADSFTFCGRRSGDGAPYCVEHARLAYQPRQAKAARRDRYKDDAAQTRRWK